MTDSQEPMQLLGGEAESSTNADNNTTTNNSRPGLPSSTNRPGIPMTNRSTGTFSGTHSLTVSRSPSTAASPRSSRESSPAGRSFRQQSVPGAASGMRSRKDSHDVSPHRPPSITGHSGTILSAAAIQRALSTATTPQLQPTPTSDPLSTSKLPRVSRVGVAGPGETTPSWPLSPRLKSPPPSSSRRNSLRTQRKPDISTDTPNITLQNPTPTSSTNNEQTPVQQETLADSDTRATASSKTPSRGASGAPTLETVQESSAPTTPGDTPTNGISTESSFLDGMSEEDRGVASGTNTPRKSKTSGSKGDSGSDTNDKQNDQLVKDQDEQDPDSTPRAKVVVPRASLTSLKPKSGVEPTTKNMTVETETVSSIPQGTLGPPTDRAASGRTEHGGTLRAKASNDTIRPGKGRKKAARKAPSINATSASTRADIFEDRVKNAMEDATSDDSDETFVYESNPPEPPVARRSRHHSRTPSGASAISNNDQRNASRPNHVALSTQKTRSMKFTNAHTSGDEESIDRGGTIRAVTARGGSSSVHHHHLGRPGRNNTGHTSILDEPGPFLQVNKTPSLTGFPKQVPPRLINRHLQPSNGVTRKHNGYTSYDIDAEGGDDEGTPLMGTVRTSRSMRRTPQQQATRPPRYLDQYQSRGILRRFAGCIVLLVMLLLLVFGAVAFLFAISTPLADVTIVEIQSVLASEQEIMLDLVVGAINPNLLPISVGDMDIDVFAKSNYFSSEKWWREHGEDQLLPLEEGRRRRNKIGTGYGDGEEEDAESIEGDPWNPMPSLGDEPEGNRHTMLLGRLDHFDTPLTFDGSFWRRHEHFSTGSLRLSKPGNRTEVDGSERWERILLHPFELIVRGTLKYKIPLGGHAYAASVSSSVLVHPEEGIDLPAKPKDGIIKISRSLDRYREAKLSAESSAEVPCSEFDSADLLRGSLKGRVKGKILKPFLGS